MIANLRHQYKSMREFGLSTFKDTIQKPNNEGYIVKHTRFGRFFIRQFDTDIQVLRQIFVHREYALDRFPQQKSVWSTYLDILQRGNIPLIIDAGANAGFAARFFAQEYPLAQIISIEPDHGNAELCRANTKDHPQVTVVEAALGSTSGNVKLERNPGHSWAVRTSRSEAGVSIVTINELKKNVSNSELLIIKIDIEGFESDLFSCATEWIDQVFVLIVEPHDWMLPGAGSSQTLQRTMMGRDRDLLISGESLIWIKR